MSVGHWVSVGGLGWMNLVENLLEDGLELSDTDKRDLNSLLDRLGRALQRVAERGALERSEAQGEERPTPGKAAGAYVTKLTGGVPEGEPQKQQETPLARRRRERQEKSRGRMDPESERARGESDRADRRRPDGGEDDSDRE